MEVLKANPKYRCCCGSIHVVTGTIIICILVLLRIGLFIYTNYPNNIPSAAIIAILIILSLIGTFLKQPYLIMPICWILTLTVNYYVVELIGSIINYIKHDQKISIFELGNNVISICVLTWLITVVKSCFNYFKWLKTHSNFMPLKDFVDYFNNVMPKASPNQQLRIVNEGDASEEDDEGENEAVGRRSESSESSSPPSSTSKECQTESVDN